MKGHNYRPLCLCRIQLYFYSSKMILTEDWHVREVTNVTFSCSCWLRRWNARDEYTQ